VEQLKNNFLALGKKRLAILGATGIGLVVVVFIGLGTVFTPTYRPLYGDLDVASASRVVGALEQAGFKVRLDATGRVISVPEPDIARARMALADQGLPSQSSPGWEIFDSGSGLGMNSFMQRVQRLRALEGELTRSIRTLEGVENARVHLVLPEREAFSTTRPDPSASIIVQSRPGYSVSRRQALAIRALVASAVPDMEPGRVTVLSGTGEAILASDEDAPGDSTFTGLQSTLEDRMSRRVTQMLAARLGADNVRVETSVALTMERQVIRQQSFDPEQQVVRSSESRQQEREGTEAASGEVGVMNDIPPELRGEGEGAAPRSSNRSAESNEILNYEIGNVTSETVREPGDIERISVAVLVNGIYEPDAEGTLVYRDRTEAELEQLRRLVQSAIGFDAARGDTISVESMEFVAFEQEGLTGGGSAFGEFLSRNGLSILRGLFALGIVMAVLLFGVRPALRTFREAEPAALPAPEDGASPAAQLSAPGGAQITPAPPQGLPGPEGQVRRIDNTIEQLIYDESEDDLVTLASVRGGVRKRRVQSVGDLVDAEPDESLRVLKHWLAEA
jgi:flagellar M-ring protein FliF